jgi:hypothetical protein
VIVVDLSGFAKRRGASVGVQRQWLGRLGKVDNGRVGFLNMLNEVHGPREAFAKLVPCLATPAAADITFLTLNRLASAWVRTKDSHRGRSLRPV